MILYQSPLSTYSLKVRLALAVKGAAVALAEPPGGSYRSPAYRRLVPPGTVPALVDGDFVLTESDAIIEYVDACFDGPALLPPDPRGRARARMLSRLADMKLEAGLRRLFPAVKEGRPIAAQDLDEPEAALLTLCAMADTSGPFGCGPEPTLPDFGLAAALVWMDLLAARRGLGGAGGAGERRLDRWRAAIDADERLFPLLRAYRDVAQAWLDQWPEQSLT